MSIVGPDRVLARISQLTGRSPGDFDARTPLSELVAESFDLVELAISLQEDFDAVFTQADLQRVATVGDICDLICSDGR